LIAKYQQLAVDGQESTCMGQKTSVGVEEIVKRGSLDRLNPIIMTALTTALSLIPMVLSASKAGNEIQAPMAVVVLGGLFTSTLLNIFVVPVVYIWYVNRKERKKEIKA
jgi:Cu/Ag efflux pump CusA